MSEHSDLANWLRKQLDEDERVARASLTDLRYPWMAGFSPTRLLAEVEAKREIVGWLEMTGQSEAIHVDAFTVATECVRSLARAYAGREGYRQEWRS